MFHVGPRGVTTSRRERVGEGAVGTEQAWVKDLQSHGWQLVGETAYFGQYVLFRELPGHGSTGGGAKIAPKSHGAGEGQDPLETLERPAKLRAMGAISEDEYEAKKTELLGRL